VLHLMMRSWRKHWLSCRKPLAIINFDISIYISFTPLCDIGACFGQHYKFAGAG
jgi:hypothetical protein